MALEGNLVSSFSEDHLVTLFASSFSLVLCLVILSIFSRPKRDLYENSFGN